jgi:hypothetical protein
VTASTDGAVVRVDATLDWGEAEIPQSSASVRVARLRKGPAGALSLAVRFPPGWERAAAGHYEVEETFVVLEGAIELNGRSHGAGELVIVPALVARTYTATPAGAVCLARFAGTPRWTDGDDGPGASGYPTRIVAFDTSSANGKRLLHRHEDGSTSWLAAAAAAAPAPSATELVLPRSFGWAFVERGATVPALAEPAVLRESPGQA